MSVDITPTDPNCPNTDGMAAATVSDGSGSYTYNWSNGQMLQTATGLEGGIMYTLIVTDMITSCTAMASVTLTSCGPAIPIGFNSSNELSFGDPCSCNDPSTLR